MNSVATATGGAAAFLGAIFMLLPRWLFGADDTGAAAIIFIVAMPVALALCCRCGSRRTCSGPDDSTRAIHGSVVYAVATGWLHGVRTVARGADGRGHAGRAGRASDGARHQHPAGAGDRAAHRHRRQSRGWAPRCCSSRPPALGSFLATVLTPAAVAPVGPLRHRQRRAGVRRGRPAVRRGPAAADDDRCAASCSARPARWSSCAPTPRCRSTSTTPCAGTCSPSRTRCSGCRSSSRSRWRRR